MGKLSASHTFWFLYLPFWLPIIAYCAGSEWISQTYAARWSPLCFVGLMFIGGGYLLYVLKGRQPQLFIDAESSMVSVNMIIKPTGTVTVLYLIKVIYDRWATAARNRQA